MSMIDDLREVVLMHRPGTWMECLTTPRTLADVAAVDFIRTHADQIEQDARDAERYRWLRDKSYGRCEYPICVAQLPQMLGSERVGTIYAGPVIGEVLDRAIDAATAKESG